MDKKKQHTFVICAYKEVPYLEECVESLLNQTYKSNIIISTSTPNKYIENVSKKYGIKLVVNKTNSNHITDFCFAYKQAKTKYVTLCHQDDVYLPNFAEKVIEKMEKEKNPLIAFTNYNELKDGVLIETNKVLKIKHFMNLFFNIKPFSNFKFIKKFILSLGCPICAPTVTYNKDKISQPIIESDLKSNIDWISWIYFSNLKGSFVYLKEKLLIHRIHSLSTTSLVLANSQKHKEDELIFSKFWPKCIVKILLKLYATSEINYQLEKEVKNGKRS